MKGQFLEWYSYYKGGKFESVIKYIIGNYRKEYNNLDKNLYAFNDIIYLIKTTNAEKIKESFELSLNYLQKKKKI